MRLLKTLTASASAGAPVEAPPQLDAFRGSLVDADKLIKTLGTRGFLSRCARMHAGGGGVDEVFFTALERCRA